MGCYKRIRKLDYLDSVFYIPDSFLGVTSGPRFMLILHRP
jgi:hypothetical protein